MQPPVTTALHNWRAAWSAHERAAQDAMATAFPALERDSRPAPCLHPRMRWERPGEGTGTVCLDDHGRATVEFEHVPKTALGAALNELFGPDWFDEGPDGISGAAPGTYSYEDESTYAEYEVVVHQDGTATLHISYVKVDDMVAILDELETALAGHRTG